MAIIQVMLSISSIRHREKIATLLIFFFFYDKVSVWKLPISVEGVRKDLSPRSGCGQKYKFGGCYSGQLQAEARCIVQHPVFEEIGEG